MRTIVLLFLLCLSVSSIPAAETSTNYFAKAQEALKQGKTDEAIRLLSAFLEMEPTNTEAYFRRAQIYESRHEPAKAILDYDRILKVDPKSPDILQWRGWAWFKTGEMGKAIEDFDRYLQFMPGREAHHWQRGIAYYYAGRYEDGKKQFELHQKVNSEDVENAVWHFLCVAKISGPAKARDSFIKISDDRRVPMMHVHALFAGKGTVEDVLAAARAGQPSKKDLNNHLFYANLYVGLYCEAMGREVEAEKYIRAAAAEFVAEHAMGDVARADLLLREKKRKKP